MYLRFVVVVVSKIKSRAAFVMTLEPGTGSWMLPSNHQWR
jgi:hypothetical protein